MEGVSNQYVIVASDDKVIGCEDKDAVQEYLNAYHEDKIREYCEIEGIDYESLSTKKLKAIMYQEGYNNNENKIYKTKAVVKEIKKSELDEDVKCELIELLTEHNTEFYLDEYDGLSEILNKIEDLEI